MQRALITRRKIFGVSIGVLLLVGLGLMRLPHLRAQTAASKSALLFTFVTTVPGYDTGLALENASRSPTSAGQSGTCSLSFYGVTDYGARPLPPTQTTSLIPAGQQIAFSLHNGGFGIAAANDFQGYILASCDFPFAQGVAAVSDLGGNRFLSLLPATVVTNTPPYGP